MNSFISQQDSDKKHDVYDLEIDRYVISILKDISPIGHNGLKKRAERVLKKKISPHTFSKHLARLISKGVLHKEEYGIGKKIEYSLTKLALNKISLGLLDNDQEKVNLLKRVYSTIFFYDANCLPKITTSEKDFERLLAQFKLNKDDLNWLRETFAENTDAANLAYGVGSSNTFFNLRYLAVYFDFWKDRDGRTPVLEQIKHFAVPKWDINLDFEIERIDYWQFNKGFPIYNYIKEYYFYLPGFSSSDIQSIHTDIDPGLLQDGLDRLEKMGLIKELVSLNGGTRFRLSDDSLRNLLAAAWTIHRDGEFDRLLDKWSFFEPPTEDETRRMEILLGCDEAGRIFHRVDLKRSKFNVFKRKCKSANELHNYIIWEWTPRIAEIDVGNRSSVPDGEDLKFLYRISNEFKDLTLVQWLDKFKEMKKSGKIAFKKRTKNEAEEYFEFLRDGLYRELKYLPFSADDNIEDIKIALRDSILNYAFLEDIIRDICPKILEPIDEDIQQEIEEIEAQSKMRADMTDLIYVIKQRIKGKMIVREIRNRSEIHEFQASCLRLGTVFDYDIQKTFNSYTQKFECREIFHLLNQKELESGKFSSVHVIERAYNPITQKMEELPVIKFLDTNKTHTTKKKSKKSRNN